MLSLIYVNRFGFRGNLLFEKRTNYRANSIEFHTTLVNINGSVLILYNKKKNLYITLNTYLLIYTPFLSIMITLILDAKISALYI